MKWFYSSSIYKLWKRFLTWVGDIMLATKPPKVKAEHIRRLLSTIKKGDIICRKYSYYLDSYFIKGSYSHSGICVSDALMVHAIAEGVGEIDVIDFVKDTDGFIILRPSYTSSENMNRALEFAAAQIGKPYDFIFNDKDVNYFYCHELTWNALKSANIFIVPKEKIIYADDLIKSCEKIYETNT